jgi:hypothetical protein
MIDREKKNKNIAFSISLGVHVALFLLLFFLAAWRAPNPPLPEYGIELNFGLDTEGSGTEQPTESVGNTEEITESEPTEETIEPEPTPTNSEPEVVTQKEGDVAVKEEPKKEVVKPVQKPKEEPVKTETKPVEEPKAVYKPTESATGKPGNQGDDANKTGDKGNPEGSLDARALYGKPGGGGGGDGIVLQMSGWAWADKPVIPELPDNQDGRIVFEIECDDQGEILTINTVERGLSPQAERILKDEIRKNSLIRTSAGITPERSKGRVVFVLKTK